MPPPIEQQRLRVNVWIGDKQIVPAVDRERATPGRTSQQRRQDGAVFDSFVTLESFFGVNTSRRAFIRLIDPSGEFLEGLHFWTECV